MKNLDGDNGSSARADDDPNDKIDRVATLDEIKRVHSEVDGSVLDCWRKNLPKMIRLGEMLATLKDAVGQGKWIEWFEENEWHCGFGKDTEENYRRIYKNRSLLEQPDSEHVRNLTDALILIKERDPAKRKALLDDAARTGKSIRSAKQRARNREIPKDPAERSRGLTQEALRIFHRLWTQDTLVPTLRDGEPQQWVQKAQGSTAKEIAEDAYRLLKLSLSAAHPDAQAREEPPVDDSDQAGPAGPLVSVEQPEESKRTPERYSMAHPATQAESDAFVVEGRFKKFLRELSKFVPIKRAHPILQRYLEKTFQRRLDVEFSQAVNDRVQEFLENTIGPQLQKEQDEARRVIASRKGIMDKKAFRKIVECLHSDRVIDPVLKPKYDEAFSIFMDLEKVLLDEKNSPTPFVQIPKTPAEWAERKRKPSEQKKSKKNTGTAIL
jgi:hypothetical protein